jgi:hypothetical protein
MIKNRDAIINFVQNVLGCGCPPEVFDDIKLSGNYRLCQYTILKYKIIIGGKLLIYIIENPELEYINDNLMNVIFMGKIERTTENLNRFRLVLISNNIDEIRKSSEEYFSAMSKDDDKMHLHLISPEDLPVI